jgi:hypothetical protein
MSFATVPATADIITDWSSVKPPPVPVLKPVKLDGKPESVADPALAPAP